MTDLTSEAAFGDKTIPKKVVPGHAASAVATQASATGRGQSLPAAIAIGLIATGAVGTVAWCGMLAYGTFRLISG